MITLALKVDVDTERGTRLGVPALAALLRESDVPACFLFSLGPDNTGRAIRRVFRPGFFKKVSRTGVVGMYGVRTLLNGTLLPAPHIGQKHAGVMRAVRDAGFETGIHCHDHFRWQDFVRAMPLEKVRAEFAAALAEYQRVFGAPALAAGAPGWQTCANARLVYDEARLLYSSDTRGGAPFFPRIDGRVFDTLEIPSTLPTFDELLGRPGWSDGEIVAHIMRLLRDDALNVFTLHAEIEGMKKQPLFRALLEACRARGVRFVRLDGHARALLRARADIPVRDIVMAPIDGRSGLVATQAERAS
ncbi:4-deoxy-4-formamido-L-arabinose-phosphoundecaprenol deformylase [Termitidicoccus mucosus]|uniref:Polysaccharide deacetylase n=1 Tax=Termitidicoccus mucosus TaxID=1184151 RepID=A0A178IJS8_9BACT|nr:polysaccharide deacetylase [Opitutaceae bacterium TSB47]